MQKLIDELYPIFAVQIIADVTAALAYMLLFVLIVFKLKDTLRDIKKEVLTPSGLAIELNEIKASCFHILFLAKRTLILEGEDAGYWIDVAMEKWVKVLVEANLILAEADQRSQPGDTKPEFGYWVRLSPEGREVFEEIK